MNILPQWNRWILVCISEYAVCIKRQWKKEHTGKPHGCQVTNDSIVYIRSIAWRLRTGEWQHSTMSAKHLFFTLNAEKWNEEGNWLIVPLQFTVTSTHFELVSNSKSSLLCVSCVYPPQCRSEQTEKCLCFIPSINAFLRHSSNTNNIFQLKCIHDTLRTRIISTIGEKRENFIAFTAECSLDMNPEK